jgi:hypothetical protein
MRITSGPRPAAAYRSRRLESPAPGRHGCRFARGDLLEDAAGFLLTAGQGRDLFSDRQGRARVS